ncbi:MAG: ABC transporter ATP-binding protein/permease [Candidatus Binatia bacterium]|nr:ABC transporter ATP-binding protein/permease [Candidatus Binatia bacterium]
MSRLWGYLRRYRGRYAAGALALLLTATMAMAIPYLLKRAVDSAALGHGAQVVQFALLVVVIAIAQAVARTFSRALIFNVGRDVEYDLRNDLFAHLLRLPVSYYRRNPTGDVMSRLVNDVTAVRMVLGPGVLNLINTPLYYAYGLAIMCQLDAWLTVLALSPYPVLLGVVKFLSRRLMEGTLRVQEGLAGLAALVQENVSGAHIVRAHAAEEIEIERFRKANDSFQSVSVELARIRGRLFPLMRLASGAGSLVVLWYGGYLVIRNQLTVGDLVAFLGYLNLLAWPTMALGWILSVFQRGRAAMRRLEEILSLEPTIAEAPRPISPREVRGEVEFRNVTFAYPGRERTPALRELNLRIPARALVAIVGRTGAGKTTLAALVPRLWDPISGTVHIDGHDLRSWPLSTLRRTVCVVPQDPFLFSATLRENIAFAAEHASDDEIWRAVRLAGLEQDLERLPRGLDTMVGERGVLLSGGQKQRVTLARALLSPAPIVVLDDPLSSVDAETERRILEGLLPVLRERTTILISHRLSTVRYADTIVVLERGRVVEVGRHDQLLMRGGTYAALFRQQELEEAIAAL